MNKLSDKEIKRIVSRLKRIRQEEERRGNSVKVEVKVEPLNHLGFINGDSVI